MMGIVSPSTASKVRVGRVIRFCQANRHMRKVLKVNQKAARASFEDVQAAIGVESSARESFRLQLTRMFLYSRAAIALKDQSPHEGAASLTWFVACACTLFHRLENAKDKMIPQSSVEVHPDEATPVSARS